MIDEIKNFIFVFITFIVALFVFVAVFVGLCVKVVFDFVFGLFHRKNNDESED